MCQNQIVNLLSFSNSYFPMKFQEVCLNQIKEIISVVKETYDLYKILDLLDLINSQNTLVIFDVDEVLITPSSEDSFRHPYRDRLLQSIFNRIKPKEIESLKISIFLNSTQILVEPRITSLFEQLKSHKITTIALTAMGTGKFGSITKCKILGLNN